MVSSCKDCANCLTTRIVGETRFWCKDGAFDFAHVPEDHEMDFEYLPTICRSFENMADDE